jgi:ribosomal protein S6E (S10)
MSKSRIIGAGIAGSTIYYCNVNLNIAGGTKKQGLPFSPNEPVLNRRVIKIRANGVNRKMIFTINQVGGIGHTTTVTRGGLRPKAPYVFPN